MGNDQPRKLIEVALPLPEISKASVADKNRKVGTIKNLHKWFAPMPTPALRALIFASLVNDPGNDEDREKLSEFIKELVPGNGSAPDEGVLEKARKLIERDNPELPTVLEPFCGGGSTVVEAQRLGLPVVASDLNPVAVLITRVLGELLPPMAHAPAVSAALADGPDTQPMIPKGTPFEGYIADLRYYGGLVQEAVQKKLGGLYPDIPQGDPVAWLWSRTVPCPNPMCGATVPLFSSSVLSNRPAAMYPLRLSSRARTSGFFYTTRKTGLAGHSRFQGVVRGSSAQLAVILSERRRSGKLGVSSDSSSWRCAWTCQRAAVAHSYLPMKWLHRKSRPSFLTILMRSSSARTPRTSRPRFTASQGKLTSILLGSSPYSLRSRTKLPTFISELWRMAAIKARPGQSHPCWDSASGRWPRRTPNSSGGLLILAMGPQRQSRPSELRRFRCFGTSPRCFLSANQ